MISSCARAGGSQEAVLRYEVGVAKHRMAQVRAAEWREEEFPIEFPDAEILSACVEPH